MWITIVMCSVKSSKFHLFYPAVNVLIVFYAQRILCKYKRVEGVDHYGEFFCFGFAYTFFHSAGVWPVRYAGRMQGYHTALYMLAAHKVAIYIVQHFITVYIAVVIWGRYGKGVIIEQAWYE